MNPFDYISPDDLLGDSLDDDLGDLLCPELETCPYGYLRCYAGATCRAELEEER